MYTAFLLQFFSLLQQLCAVGHVIFNMAHVNTFFVGTNNCLFSQTNILKQFLSG